MGKKFGFLVGLAAGAAAAHVAYRRLSDEDKEQLKADLQEKMDIAKDRAVDYAFYASDAWDDFKETFSDQTQTVSDRVKQAANQFGDTSLKPNTGDDDSLRDELADVSTSADDDSDDIVLNSEDTFGGADVADESKTSTDDPESPDDSDETKQD
ncbi:YtxH domain-containing protein [Lactobacillus sp. LC28-10]|uniref:YtxH domain-containing protein n=1 Tax=Secundilactobacillus angelensis TaxID=2722706 RepID=A0ABX1KX73_9LACO|nr:YtxH domain-containing protein [Secundilactobacillus angelensis]MCH5462595.1 YtxH domain-containing protein [Secundilactobacillus angelensis]NLR18214.1 YtxH domain-containing protein [Secundilactobacillus angelensis]